jgi:hypothetical protein
MNDMETESCKCFSLYAKKKAFFNYEFASKVIKFDRVKFMN